MDCALKESSKVYDKFLMSIKLFECWEEQVARFAMRDRHVQEHPELQNIYQRRRYVRDLESLTSLRLCLLLLYAYEEKRPPYTLNRLAQEMGGKNTRECKLLKKQLRTLLERIAAFRMLDYSCDDENRGQYKIKASSQLLQFFNERLMFELL